jgi:hypothetical protein
MATIGNTATPTQFFSFYTNNASDTLAIQVTMPTAGLLTSVSAYFAGHGMTITARVCVWNSSRVLVAQSADLSVGSGGGGLGGQFFNTGTLTSGYSAANGEVLYLGFWRHASQTHEWTEQNGGTEYQYTSLSNVSPPSGFGAWNATSGTPSIYATYTAGGGTQKVFIRRVGAWAWHPFHPRRSSAWANANNYIRRGASWTQVS